MSVYEEASQRRSLSLAEAIDLCGKHFGFDPIVVVTLDGEDFEIRFSTVWSLEQSKAFKALDDFVETLDHEEVPNRNQVTGEILVHPVTGEVDSERLLKAPHQVDGVEIDPPYGLRYLAAMFGGLDKARRAESAGLTYGVVNMLVGRMGDQFAQWQRQRNDSKSR